MSAARYGGAPNMVFETLECSADKLQMAVSVTCF